MTIYSKKTTTTTTSTNFISFTNVKVGLCIKNWVLVIFTFNLKIKKLNELYLYLETDLSLRVLKKYIVKYFFIVEIWIV